MRNDELREVYRQHRAATDKYTYFLLAAAGAAIGFAVTQTSGVKFELAQLPVGGAVVAWGLSFFFGCLHLRYVMSTLYANAMLLRVVQGEEEAIGRNPALMVPAVEGIREAMKDNEIRSGRFSRWQFSGLILGAVLYVAWHVLRIYLATI